LSLAVEVAVPELVAVDVAVLPPFSAVAEAAVPPPAIEEVQVSPKPSGPIVWFPVQAKIGIKASAVPTRLPKHNKMERANNAGRKRPLVRIESSAARLASPAADSGIAQALADARPLAHLEVNRKLNLHDCCIVLQWSGLSGGSARRRSSNPRQVRMDPISRPIMKVSAAARRPSASCRLAERQTVTSAKTHAVRSG
jgi:hypothetical protein